MYAKLPEKHFFIKKLQPSKIFQDCEGMYEVYKDIADTYYAIAKRDYISKYIDEYKNVVKYKKIFK